MIVAVEATETTVAAVLESIERGDKVALQKNGHTVATVVPGAEKTGAAERTPEQIASAHAALARMDERGKRLGLKFDFAEFKADRDFGRR